MITTDRFSLNFRKVNNFILSSATTSFIGFAKSFAFMKIFGFEELGIITIITTISMLFGMLQIGLINGGYRIIAVNNLETSIKTNNFIFSYFLILASLLFITSVFSYLSGIYSDIFVLLSINLLSISSLINNWLINALIASDKFYQLNRANIYSSLLGLASLFLPLYWGLNGALLSLAVQPLIFSAIILFNNSEFLPKSFIFNKFQFQHVLKFGFVPYLSGVFVLLYQQIERWSVDHFLGHVYLGKLYLVYIVTTLWMLIPSSINNLFFPKVVNLYSKGDKLQFEKEINYFTKINLIYCILGVLGIIFILPQLTFYLFPNHFRYIHLVYISLPGLIFRVLAAPFNLFFNSIGRYKAIFWSDAISSFLYLVLIVILKLIESISLENILICFSIYSFVRFLYLFAVKKIIYEN